MRGDLDASAPEMRAAAGETGLIMASLIPLGRVLSTTGRFIGSVGVRIGRFVGIGGGRVAPVAPKVVNQLNHIFGKSEHALDDFVIAHGSQEAAFGAMQQAANQALAAGRLTTNAAGILPNGNAGHIIDVAGTQIRLIGGRVVNGVVEISSFSRKGL